MGEHGSGDQRARMRVSEGQPEAGWDGRAEGAGSPGGDLPGGDPSAGQDAALLARAMRGPPARAGGAARDVDWRRVLVGASPREVLARLMSGDPLRLAAVVEERLRARAYLFDADRVLLRTAARCARLALRYRGDPPLERWLAERADEALLDLLRADAESDMRGELPGPERLAAFEALARPLGLDPARMHRACLAHNQLSEAQRRAFREVVIEGRSLDALAARGERSATEIARAARTALRTMLAVVGEEGSP